MAAEAAFVEVDACARHTVIVEWAFERAPSDLANAVKIGPIVLKYLC